MFKVLSSIWKNNHDDEEYDEEDLTQKDYDTFRKISIEY